MVPTKPFGVSAGIPGVMMGGGARRAPNTAASDGLSALQARLAGASKMKAMKPPMKRPRTQNMTKGTGLMPGKGA